MPEDFSFRTLVINQKSPIQVISVAKISINVCNGKIRKRGSFHELLLNHSMAICQCVHLDWSTLLCLDHGKFGSSVTGSTSATVTSTRNSLVEIRAMCQPQKIVRKVVMG